MKPVASILPLALLIFIGFQIRSAIMCDYNYENAYGNLWDLADKSSTILEKQKYLSQFAIDLQRGYKHGDFANYNAIWLKTPNNSFVYNLKALQTLVDRLTQIQQMNPNSFEYNTAIQQITGQEQGEAKPMLKVFEDCYILENYPILWGWIFGWSIFIEIILLIVFILILAD